MISYTTLQDAIEHGLDYLGSVSSDNARRDCVRAAIEAMRDIGNAHNWSYLYTHGRVVTSAAFDGTGATVTYKQVGDLSNYDYQLTISGAVWPDWANWGYIRIATGSDDPTTAYVAYRVAERKSATVLTLTPTLNPGADITTPATFTLYRDTYPLPEDYISQDQALYQQNFGGMQYTHPREWLYENRYVFNQGTPNAYTITGDPSAPGRLVLRIFPWPIQSQTIDFLYKRRPRPLKVAQVSGGTASITAGSNVLTGIGTAFTPQMVGCVVRLGSDADVLPTSLVGDNPAQFETLITDWVSATSVMLQDASPAAISGVVYTIGDIIDVEQGVMLNAYWRCVEMHLGMNRTMKDKPSAALQYKDALSKAKAADSRSFAGRAVGDGGGYRPRMKDMPMKWD